MKNSMKNSRKELVKRIILIFLSSLLLSTVFLFYGPIKEFREIWILTAMNTSNSKYLAEMLYTQDYINEVLLQNKVVAIKEQTSDEIQKVNFGDGYSFEEIRERNFRGYLFTVDDPARLQLVRAPSGNGNLLGEIVGDSKVLVAMNASGYNMIARDVCAGLAIYNYEIRNMGKSTWHQIVGMDANNTLKVGTYSGTQIRTAKFRWAVEFGPVLIVNGKSTDLTKYAGGFAPRTAIGQTQEGKILMLVIDGRQLRSIGATFKDVQEILRSRGAINACNLDGGKSSAMYYQGRTINSPSEVNRRHNLPNALIVK